MLDSCHDRPKAQAWLFIHFHISWSFLVECSKIPMIHREESRRHLPVTSKDAAACCSSQCLLRMLLTHLQLLCRKLKVHFGEGSCSGESCFFIICGNLVEKCTFKIFQRHCTARVLVRLWLSREKENLPNFMR